MRTLGLVLLLLVSGCGGCGDDAAAVCDATYGPPIDGAPDATVIDATPDAMAPDAMAPDATPSCVTAGDDADHLEALGADIGGFPQMTADAFGAAALLGDSGGGARLVFLGADGARRAADVDLPEEARAIAFDGLGYWISERSGQDVRIRSVSATGVLGTPVTIGTGQPVFGAIAVHADGDVAVLWTANVDGSLRATVVPPVGSPVETVLDTPASTTVLQLIGGVAATTGDAAKFVAAYARVDSSSAQTVMARALAPAGTAVQISTGGATQRHRVGIAPGATTDTFLILWAESTTVHVATYHPTDGIALADRIAVTPAGTFFTRIGGRSGPGTGLEVLVDHFDGDRQITLHALDAAGDPATAPRRIATICTNAYSEENLPFVRNATVRYVTWYDMAVGSSFTAAF